MVNSIVSQSPSAAVHGTQREEEHPSPLHRLVSSSTNSATSLLPPICIETSSSPPILVTPPRSSSKINHLPRGPPRKVCSFMTAARDAVYPMSHGEQQQPDPEQNEIEAANIEQAAADDSFNATTTGETLDLIPESSPPRNKQRSSSRPSTPSSNSSSAASCPSSRYSPASSSGSLTPPSASSYEPLSTPSSSELRQRRRQREVPPVPLPTLFHDAGSCMDNRTSVRSIGDDYRDNNKKKNSEQYPDQQHRLRQILQQNFGKYQHKEKDDDDVCVGVRSCDSSLASSQHLQHSSDDSNFSNMEGEHEREQDHNTQEHEIVINPKSIKGTIESASFHLHGQTGGRVKSDLKNAAVMDAYALRNIMMDTDESSMSDTLEDRFETNIRIDLENGVNVISNRGGRKDNNNNHNKSNLMIDNGHHDDLWSTGIAAAVVMGTAARYHKTFFMFPHGRKVILPIIVGTVALCLSIVTLKSCRFLTVLPEENSQVFELGPWSYLSPGTVYDGEVCLPYPSDVEVDTPFMVARMASVLATCLGGGLLLLTTTMMCIPYGKSSISLLGLGYILAGVLQALTMVHYQTDNCKGGGYFRGLQCKPNQDLVFCLAASVLYLACGWVLYMLQTFIVAPPGHSASQIYTCSANSKSSDDSKGLLRTVEKSWTKIPSGETLVATVLVERRMGSDGKIKTMHSIQTELIDQ